MARACYVSREIVEAAIRENAGKISPLEIAAELDISRSHVLNVAADIGVSLQLTKNKEAAQYIKDTLKEHHKTMLYTDIAKKCNTSPANVIYQAKRLGLEIKMRMGPRKKEVVPRAVSTVFDPHERENWLI